LSSGFRWIYRDCCLDDKQFQNIKKSVGSTILAKLLSNRGINTPEKALQFLTPGNYELSSPYIFPDMEKVLNRIDEAIVKQESIVVYGDFDADGVTSTVLLMKTLLFLGANISYYIPDRAEEGHGLNRSAVCKIISSRKAKLIITVDCGISNPAEVKLAESLGTNIIITDHHEPSDEIPHAYAIINPKMLNDELDLKYLAGVGVAYKLAEALLKKYNSQDFCDEIIYLAAIGTIGDIVPLIGENRIIVRKGLDIITQKKPPGIAKLLEISGYKPHHKVTSGTVAFGIVPRINAMGRLMDANPAVEFLLSENSENINLLAKELDINNKERQQICESIAKEADEKLLQEIDFSKNKGVVLASEGWHPGIIGIVASQLVEKYHRPVLLISTDSEKKEGRCSARSIHGLNLFETLSEFSDYFLQFGGHYLAAGFFFSLEKISANDLMAKINAAVNKNLDSSMLKPELKIDMDVEATDITEDFVKELDKLAPYGESNPYPVFSMKNLQIKNCKRIGPKKNHLKIQLCDEHDNLIDAVWWHKECLNTNAEEKIDIAFTPSINVYQDKTAVQLLIKDIKTNLEPDEPEAVIETICPEEPYGSEPLEVFENTVFVHKNSYTASTSGRHEFFDHRVEKGFKKDFLSYIKKLGRSASIFAESAKASNVVKNFEFLKELAANRIGIGKSDCLVILDMPCDEKVFTDVIKKASPGKIHLFGLTQEIEPLEIIRKFSGMLRFAHREKQGIINIEQTAAILAVSFDALNACIKLLDKAGVIEILEIKEKIIEFSFKQSVPIESIIKMPEYQNILSIFEKSKSFQKRILNSRIDELNSLITGLAYSQM
jgi:single-stranded-DNA-specific exonuclease